MTTIILLAIAIGGVVLLALLGLATRHMPRRLNQNYFDKRWKEILTRVKTADGMILAVIDADKLLDEALKRRHFKGKTMGERLVSAQRSLSTNDSVWQAHKLRNRLVHENNVKLRKSEAQHALSSFKQALKDVGAM